MNDTDNPDELLQKYNQGNCIEEEKTIVENWFLSWKEEGTPPSKKEIEQVTKDILRLLPQPVIKTVRVNRPPTSSINWPLRVVTVAAAIVILLGIWTLVFVKTPSAQHYNNDIGPGTNQATLTLSNGKIINLSNKKNTIIIDGQKLTYNDGSLISDNNLSGFQTITTPKGGEYQIVLPDGTKVWLNAASTLEYPADFRERSERKVELRHGEAYFEVAKDKNRPFIVSAANQSVLVLGTHFNINLYNPKEGIKTTLLEGSVKITAKNPEEKDLVKTLKPDEQAINSGITLMVKPVDVDLEIAWKIGKIRFEDADLKTVMDMLEQWYNIEVAYEDYPVKSRFSGSVSRSKSISEVLRLLETTQEVHFKIEGRKVIVMK